MVAAAHSGEHGGAPRNGGRLPEAAPASRCDRPAAGAAAAGKTGQRGDHRLWRWQNRPSIPAKRPIRLDAKPANGVITDLGAELTARRPQTPEPQPGRSPPPAPVCRIAKRSNWGCPVAATPWPSGRIWWTPAASPAAIRASGASSRKLRGSHVPEARAVIVTAPGEEAQVDYGAGPMVRDPQSGKYRRTDCSC